MMPVGCLLSGPLIDKLGRRTALIVTNVPSFLGWTLLSVSQPGPLGVLYAGQLLVGLSVGLSTTPATVYAAECITVNMTQLRGCFTIMTSIVLNFGMCLTYLLGVFMPAYVVAYVAAFVSAAASVLIALLIPESPPWLYEQGRHGDAEFSQKVLRIEQPALLKPKEESAADGGFVFGRLCEPDVAKPIAIMTAFLFFQQFSGTYVLTAYMIQVLRRMHVTANGYLVMLAGGLANLSAMVLLSVLLSTSNFKRLTYVSCAGYGASMVALAGFLCLDVRDAAITNATVVACVLIIMAMNGLGLRPIPYAMLGEVFPTDVAGVASSIVACMSSVFNFVAIKMHPYLMLWIGTSGTFAAYGTLSLCAIAFVAVFVPDTKGKSIEQIGDDFLKSSDSSTDVAA